jgi:hypothetical protein
MSLALAGRTKLAREHFERACLDIDEGRNPSATINDRQTPSLTPLPSSVRAPSVPNGGDSGQLHDDDPAAGAAWGAER